MRGPWSAPIASNIAIFCFFVIIILLDMPHAGEIDLFVTLGKG